MKHSRSFAETYSANIWFRRLGCIITSHFFHLELWWYRVLFFSLCITSWSLCYFFLSRPVSWLLCGITRWRSSTRWLLSIHSKKGSWCSARDCCIHCRLVLSPVVVLFNRAEESFCSMHFSSERNFIWYMLFVHFLLSCEFQCLEQCFHAEGNGLPLNALHSDEYKVSTWTQRGFIPFSLICVYSISDQNDAREHILCFSRVSRLSKRTWLTTLRAASSSWRSSLKGKYGSRWDSGLATYPSQTMTNSC